jgi:hypothetical protein
VAVGDFTGNGKLDLVTANFNTNTVSVLLGNGDGTFQPAVNYTVGYAPYAVAVGYFSHNGYLDIVTANYGAGTVSVLLGNGNGTFQPAVNYTVGKQPHSVAVGDFFSDGNVDIVSANFGDNTVSVLRGNGDGTFQPAASYPVGIGPFAVTTVDFNRQGNLDDIATANFGDNTVSLLQNNGDGIFLPAGTYPVGYAPAWIAAGQFTSDGNLDLVTANFGDSTLSVLLGNGNLTFQPAVSYAVGGGPVSVAAGDLSHDGKLDLVVADFGANTVSVLLGNGDGTFQPAGIPLLATPPFASVLAFGADLVVVPVSKGSDGLAAAFVELASVFGGNVAPGLPFGAGAPTRLAGFESGMVGAITADPTSLTVQQTNFTDAPSALLVLQNVDRSFAVPNVTALPPGASVAEATNLPGFDLLLVATLSSGALLEDAPRNTAPIAPGFAVFDVFSPILSNGDTAVAFMFAPVFGPVPSIAVWMSFASGVEEALRQHVRRQRADAPWSSAPSAAPARLLQAADGGLGDAPPETGRADWPARVLPLTALCSLMFLISFANAAPAQHARAAPRRPALPKADRCA